MLYVIVDEKPCGRVILAKTVNREELDRILHLEEEQLVWGYFTDSELQALCDSSYFAVVSSG